MLPKTLGTYEAEEVVVSNGSFGPYIKFGAMYVSLDKGENPMEVDLERATELIVAKQKQMLQLLNMKNCQFKKELDVLVHLSNGIQCLST